MMGPFNRGRAERMAAAVPDFVGPVLIAAWLTMLVVGALSPTQAIAYWQALVLAAVVSAVMWPIRRALKRWRHRRRVNR